MLIIRGGNGPLSGSPLQAPTEMKSLVVPKNIKRMLVEGVDK